MKWFLSFCRPIFISFWNVSQFMSTYHTNLKDLFSWFKEMNWSLGTLKNLSTSFLLSLIKTHCRKMSGESVSFFFLWPEAFGWLYCFIAPSFIFSQIYLTFFSYYIFWLRTLTDLFHILFTPPAITIHQFWYQIFNHLSFSDRISLTLCASFSKISTDAY
jgi:hypothetical protein